MKSSTNEKVQQFLEELKAVDPTMFDLVMGLRKVIFTTHNDVSEKIMYGGIVFSLKEKMFCGIFTYKNHVSLEFSNGYLMKDPKGLLEGKGKYRRHLKFQQQEDIKKKTVDYYVLQALTTAPD